MCHDLGFGVESVDELRVVCELRPYRLDGDLPAYGRLVGAKHMSEVTFADPFAQFVTTYRAAGAQRCGVDDRGRCVRGLELWIVGEDLLFELAKLRPDVETALLAK